MFQESSDDRESIFQLDRQAMALAKKRWNAIAKPLHGLGRFEDMIVQIAGILGTPYVDIRKKAVLVMCADNGIVEEGVTQTDQSVTKIVSENIAGYTASVGKMALAAKAEVFVVDVGMAEDAKEKRVISRKVAYGTKNFLKEPAMTKEEAKKAIRTGTDMVRECRERGYRLLATGEMGIGNTTTSSAMASVMLSLPAKQVTGPGAGISRQGLERKTAVIEKGIESYKLRQEDTMEILCTFGGFDIAALTGAFMGAARYRIPIVMDGVISAVAALCAVRLMPEVKHVILPSHMGREPAMKVIMKELGVLPVIHGDLALGEGTGAVMLFPLLDMAMEVYQNDETFDKIHMKAYKEYGEETC